MTEVEFNISPYNSIDFFGVNDKNINCLRSLFPKLKIVARDRIIKIQGCESDIFQFSNIFVKINEHLDHFGKIDDADIKQLVDEINSDSKDSPDSNNSDVLVHGRSGMHIKARTENQKKMAKCILKDDMIFAIGPAGTGKTYTAVALAVRALKNKEVKRIVLTRPAVEAGESLGFLPGDLKDKLDPYLRPLYDALRDMIPFQKLSTYIEDETIEIAPLAFMRGRTLENAFVILDEAQNCSTAQLKMFLTRMGRHSKFIITGDITQIDLPNAQKSGLLYAESMLKDVKGISFIQLDKRDVVRHKLVTDIIQAFEKHEAKNKKQTKDESNSKH